MQLEQLLVLHFYRKQPYPHSFSAKQQLGPFMRNVSQKASGRDCGGRADPLPFSPLHRWSLSSSVPETHKPELPNATGQLFHGKREDQLSRNLCSRWGEKVWTKDKREA